MCNVVQVWIERDSLAPNYPDWRVGIGTFDPKVRKIAVECGGGYGIHPLREIVGRPNLGIVIRGYHLFPNPIYTLIQRLQEGGFQVEQIQRPAGI